MALFIQQNEDRSKLQERLAAELREKAKKAQQEPATTPPDGVHDSSYLKDTKKTTSFAWVWVVIVLFVVAMFVAYIVGSANN
jgi:type VI protein secretion system component VasF